MKKFCPSCADFVEYEGEGYTICSICGRTQAAAEQALASRRAQAQGAKLKWIWIIVGILAFLALFAFRPEQTLGTIISSIVQVIILVPILWGINKLRK